jgi:3-isopropylmalate/(R)-2-methylmalate dehydratase small subunit
MRSVTFDGLGEHVFRDERYTEHGKPREHPLNDPDFRGASILLVRKNFGCGSSREHAPQALKRFGFKAIIGESFAEIFIDNCTALGLPAVSVRARAAEELADIVNANPKTAVRIDLVKREVSVAGSFFPLVMLDSARSAFLEGTWDTLYQLLKNEDLIGEKKKNLPYLNRFDGF